MMRFGMELEEEMRRFGFILRGHFPLLRTSFYSLEFDFRKNSLTIWYGPRQDKLGTCMLEAKKISKRVSRFHEMITKRPFSDLEFLKGLYRAYVTAVQTGKKKMGEPLPIASLLREYVSLSQRNKPNTSVVSNHHNAIYFSYDLFRLREKGIEGFELELITATRMYTRRKRDFVWVPVNEKGEGRFISHARFRSIGS